MDPGRHQPPTRTPRRPQPERFQHQWHGHHRCQRGWQPLTATLPAGTTAVRFRYQTDGAAVESGFRVDDIAIDGTVIGTAETETEGWTFDGFKRTTGSEVEKFFNAYVAENRQYDGYDTSLRHRLQLRLRRTPVRTGWSTTATRTGCCSATGTTQYADNNVGDHPGAGLILPIDAHPTFHHWADGTLMRPRITTYDSTFGLEATDPITLPAVNGVGGQDRRALAAGRARVRRHRDAGGPTTTSTRRRATTPAVTSPVGTA